ncbi:MAG: hypothetical protein U5J83_12220 [Bryobacterales bacterium]|nr:hypothetical protein [Bryobacterales bacterium]
MLVFWATEMPTVPLPEPLVPELTVIQAAFEVAVQEQPDAEMTFVAVAPPAPAR